MKKITVLEKLLQDGVFPDAEEAKKWILLGRVLVDEERVLSAFEKIDPAATLRIKESYKREFVSKGALKLSGALDAFGVSVSGRVCLDCGASTGGFTDCLLSRGAASVYAVDAGHGMLAAKLSQDPRVENLERVNFSDERLLSLDPAPSFLSLDLSYLSLKTAWEAARGILHDRGEAVALVKPIFETADHAVRRSGECNDPALLQDVLFDLLDFFSSRAAIGGVTESPVRGNTGASEFFLHLSIPGSTDAATLSTLRTQATRAVERAEKLPPFSKERA